MPVTLQKSKLLAIIMLSVCTILSIAFLAFLASTQSRQGFVPSFKKSIFGNKTNAFHHFHDKIDFVASFKKSIVENKTNGFHDKIDVVPSFKKSIIENKTNEFHDKIDFVQKLKNRYSLETINCSWNRFKYLRLIADQLNTVYGDKSKGITTEYINKYIVNGNNFNSPQNKASQYMRLKAYNGSLYLSKYQNNLSYRFAWWLYYFMRLFEKYGKYIPDTDFIIFMGDTGRMEFDYNIFPFFLGDGIEIKHNIINGIEIKNQLPLFTMPRSYIWIHQSPVEGYADITCYRDSNGFNNFNNKINKAVFRGGASGGNWKTSKRGNVIIPSIDQQINEMDAKYSCWRKGKEKKTGGIPMKYCTEFTNTTQQMKYKYIILIDGNSVRDAYPKQLSIGSILLKQESPFLEFWYYDLINYYHIIKWNDFNHLKNIVYKLINNSIDINKQQNIAKNGRYFVDTYLTDHCIDCFVIHMIQLYNKYFFNQTSVFLSSYDILINKNTIKPLLKQGYKKHIYDFQYYCPTNNKTIKSQKFTL